MKKALSLLTVFMLAISLVVLSVCPVSAATPKEQIIAAIKAVADPDYFEDYLPTVENVLQQIEVTQEQADTVIKCIDVCDKTIEHEYGLTIADVTDADKKVLLTQFDIACDALNLTYEAVPSETPVKKNDTVYVVKTNEGQKLVEIDNDIVNKTNVPDGDTTVGFIALSAVLILGTVFAIVYSRKAVFNR